VDIIETYNKLGVVLEPSGDKWRGHCPYHAEATASFFVYPDGSYYCFGCHKYGSYESVLGDLGSAQKFLPDFTGFEEKDPLGMVKKKLVAKLQIKLEGASIAKKCNAYDALDCLLMHATSLNNDADIERLELIYHLKRAYAKIISTIA